MSPLVVLTCASGKQCSQLIPLLQKTTPGYRLRLVVHSEKSQERLQVAYPEAEVVRVDLSVPDDCLKAVKGADTIYYVGPTFQPHESQFGFNFIDAAVKESFKSASKPCHFIFSSVLHPEVSKLANHDRKRLVEEYLCESRLPYTILQPSHFADNALERLLALRDSAHPIFVAAHDPQVAFSFSCTRDHAEVSAKIIQERSKHYFATYQLASTWPMKYSEYVSSIGDVMGIKVEIRQAPYEEMVEKYCQLVFGEQQAVTQSMRDGPERLLLYYNSRGIVGNPGTLQWLLGRPGTTPAQLAREVLKARGEM